MGWIKTAGNYHIGIQSIQYAPYIRVIMDIFTIFFRYVEFQKGMTKALLTKHPLAI